MARFLRALAVLVLAVLLALTAGPALFAAAFVPRVTDPATLADLAIRSGAAAAVREQMIEGFSENMGGESGPAPERLRILLERHFTPEWLDGELLRLSGELSAWMATEEPRLPTLRLDLGPVAETLFEDPEARPVLLALAEQAREDGGLEDLDEVTLQSLRQHFPETVVLVSDEDDEQRGALLEARRRLRIARAAALASLLVPALALGLLMVLARSRRARLRWAGAGLLLAAVPALALATALPALGEWGARRVVPELPPEAYGHLSEFLSALVTPLSLLFAGVAAAGLALLVAGLVKRHGPPPTVVTSPSPEPALTASSPER